jgi:molybdopterin-guanine dinucleotide biosynthesis protein A
MKLSAVLLAGGESRRMGCDKATMHFRETPLWRHQLRRLRQTPAMEFLISARSDPPWRSADTIFVPDHPPSRGPISGVAAALAKMQGTHLLVLAIDMPLIPPTLLRSMSENIGPGRGVVPYTGSRAEPLAAVYPRECLAQIGAALNRNNFSMQPIVNELIHAGLLTVFPVSETDIPFYRSLNTPADLQTVVQSGDVPPKSKLAATPNV